MTTQAATPPAPTTPPSVEERLMALIEGAVARALAARAKPPAARTKPAEARVAAAEDATASKVNIPQVLAAAIASERVGCETRITRLTTAGWLCIPCAQLFEGGSTHVGTHRTKGHTIMAMKAGKPVA